MAMGAGPLWSSEMTPGTEKEQGQGLVPGNLGDRLQSGDRTGLLGAEGQNKPRILHGHVGTVFLHLRCRTRFLC